MTAAFSGLTWLWRAVPFREVILGVILLQLIGEQFPFSHFPMYSSLGTESELVYMTTADGALLPLQPVFAFRTAAARKQLKTERLKLERAEPGLPAAEVQARTSRTLMDYLVKRLPPEKLADFRQKGLILHRETIAFREGRLIKEELPGAAWPEP